MAAVTTTAGRPSRAVEWMRRNLFSDVRNSVVSIILGGIIVWVVVALIRFLLHSDWEIVRTNLTLFMVGRFPRDQLWRVWAALGGLSLLIGIIAGTSVAAARVRAEEMGSVRADARPVDTLLRFWPLLALTALILSFTRTIVPAVMTLVTLVVGLIGFMLARSAPAAVRRRTWLIGLGLLAAVYLVLTAFGGVGWDQWGGLFVNAYVTVAGIAFAFPIGLLLALGRRSSLPLVRALSTSYIELFRGVPLISLLLMGAFAIGFFLPASLRPGLVTRMLIVITIFESAYIAEVVRGGLQAVPRGQVEAAQALGLGPAITMRRIVLPQALRAVIPAMVGQFISLYKDTSLLEIVGVTEVLAVSSIANSQPDFLGQGLAEVTLPFVGLVFWAVAYTMSREAGRLERRLGVGER